MSTVSTSTPRLWAALYALASAVGLVILLVAAPRPGAPEEPSACRTLTDGQPAELGCLEGRKPTILTAELAGQPKLWACQLQRREALAVLNEGQARCAELRAERLRAEIVEFDNGLFIPLYATLSLLVIGWVASDVGCSRALAIAAALALATAALVALDRQENRQAVGMIDRMEALGVASLRMGPVSFEEPALVNAASDARRASLWKWGASALWAAALALAFVHALRPQRECLATRGRWVGGLANLPWLALAAAAGLFAAGTGVGLAGDRIAWPTVLLSCGMIASMVGMVGVAALVAGLARFSTS